MAGGVMAGFCKPGDSFYFDVLKSGKSYFLGFLIAAWAATDIAWKYKLSDAARYVFHKALDF